MKERLDAMLKDMCDRGDYMGLSVLAAKKGEVLYRRDYGFADREKGRAQAPDTIFHLYSMSKPVTAAAVMKLWEDGELDLYDPVSKYLPGFLNQKVRENGELVPVKSEVTVRDLLNMTSGIVYPGDEKTPELNRLFDEAMERADGPEAFDTVEFANSIGRTPLMFQPGENWQYGASADVLGAVVQVVSGMRFGDYLKETFFEPMGMKDTGFYIPPEKKDRLAVIYRMEPGKEVTEYHGRHLVIMDYEKEPSFQSGGAGLFSTMDDYLKFASMLCSKGVYGGTRYLTERTVRYMSSNQLTEKQLNCIEWQAITGYGYGNLMRVLLDPCQAAVVTEPGEFGWDGWTGTYMEVNPAEDVVIMLMTAQIDRDNVCSRRRIRNFIYQHIV